MQILTKPTNKSLAKTEKRTALKSGGGGAGYSNIKEKPTKPPKTSSQLSKVPESHAFTHKTFPAEYGITNAAKSNNNKVFTVEKLGIKVVVADLVNRKNDKLFVHKVVSVQRGGAAYIAGVQPGDLIKNYYSGHFFIPKSIHRYMNPSQREIHSQSIKRVSKWNTENIIKLIDMKITINKGVRLDFIWKNSNSSRRDYDSASLDLVYKGPAEGDWISTGGTNGIIPDDGRPNLPGVIALRKRINKQADKEQERTSELTRQFENDVLKLDLSNCKLPALDDELAKNGVKEKELTQYILTSQFVPPLEFIYQQLSLLYKCTSKKNIG